MSEQPFTAGPWVVDPMYPSEVQTQDNLTIASCWHERCVDAQVTLQGILPCSMEESAANARLIAAAPAMYEALKAILPAVDAYLMSGDAGARDLKARTWNRDVQRARAALSQASKKEGE